MSYFDELYHYGTPRHSGRYPWGSGENPYQHEDGFLQNVESLRKQGLSEKEIADYFGVSTTELRKMKSVAKAEQHIYEDAEIRRLHEEGWTNVAIAEKLGKSEGYVRNRLNPIVKERAEVLNNTADILKTRMGEVPYVDIGSGTESLMGISKTKMDAAIQKLVQEEGYHIYYIQIPQASDPNQKTTVKVLAPPDASYSDVYNHTDQIGLVEGYYTEDGGRSYLGIRPPTSVNSDRIMVRYGDEDGSDKDGVIELRRNVDDLSLGNANYAQVRIAVDGTHYLKGMAMYSDKLPEGVDIIFNTNKPSSTSKMDVFKELKKTADGEVDMDNPFGATISRQSDYILPDGTKALSPINIVREEGEWSTWSKTLASQFLSKQPTALIKQQLGITLDNKKAELDEIMALTNPEIKKVLLESFANDCDSDAVHLKAAALPRQTSKVILPLTNIKDDEIYAPSYKNGEQVALVRYPHGGTFEIPVLTVNNKNKDGQNYIGKQPLDAVGISSKVAQRLSGADFDGDTVVVIPTINQKIKSTSPLAELRDFDPKQRYPYHDGMKVMSKKNTQTEMGKISNLINDMTIKGASDSEIARAVKHSMVVIDANKHKLDYKQSELDNNIKELKEKYQNGGGASTLISRASADKRISKREEITNVEKMTDAEKQSYLAGKKVYRDKPEYYVDRKTGKEKERLEKTTQMAVTDDARTLSSGTIVENMYAEYANSIKRLGESARAESRNLEMTKYNKSAKETYSAEVASLNSKLNTALKSKPFERQAQILANNTFKAKLKDNPELYDDNDAKKKIRTQAIAEARARTPEAMKKSSTEIKITDKEWDAIQSGAISSSKVLRILENTDQAKVKEYATPRTSTGLSSSQESRIRKLANAGYTQDEIADSVGISVSAVSKYMSEQRGLSKED